MFSASREKLKVTENEGKMRFVPNFDVVMVGTDCESQLNYDDKHFNQGV